jgi:hypothetical protein
MGDFNVEIIKDNNQPKKNKNYYISWINSNYNHNIGKTPQNMDLN